MRKMLLPRLYALLRHACYGAAQASFPALLPLLVLLPRELLQPQPDVVAQLLDSAWAGLQEAAGRCGRVWGGGAGGLRFLGQGG